MSAPRKARVRDAQPAVCAVDRALLARCGLVNATGQVVGVEGPHPDARLLAMVAEYTTIMQTVYAQFRRLSQYKEDGRAYKRLWREILSTRDREEELEEEIVATRAHTPIGVLAKLGLYVDRHADNTGTMFSRPVAVMREAMAMLEGTPVHAPREPA